MKIIRTILLLEKFLSNIYYSYASIYYYLNREESNQSVVIHVSTILLIEGTLIKTLLIMFLSTIPLIVRILIKASASS